MKKTLLIIIAAAALACALLLGSCANSSIVSPGTGSAGGEVGTTAEQPGNTNPDGTGSDAATSEPLSTDTAPVDDTKVWNTEARAAAISAVRQLISGVTQETMFSYKVTDLRNQVPQTAIQTFHYIKHSFEYTGRVVGQDYDQQLKADAYFIDNPSDGNLWLFIDMFYTGVTTQRRTVAVRIEPEVNSFFVDAKFQIEHSLPKAFETVDPSPIALMNEQQARLYECGYTVPSINAWLGGLDQSLSLERFGILTEKQPAAMQSGQQGLFGEDDYRVEKIFDENGNLRKIQISGKYGDGTATIHLTGEKVNVLAFAYKNNGGGAMVKVLSERLNPYSGEVAAQYIYTALCYEFVWEGGTVDASLSGDSKSVYVTNGAVAVPEQRSIRIVAESKIPEVFRKSAAAASDFFIIIDYRTDRPESENRYMTAGALPDSFDCFIAKELGILN